jgi:hypothetical protein
LSSDVAPSKQTKRNELEKTLILPDRPPFSFALVWVKAEAAMSYRFCGGARVAAGVKLTCGLLIAPLAGVPYDFLMYSLLLFGAVVLAGGVAAIRATAGIARCNHESEHRAPGDACSAGYRVPGHASSGHGSSSTCAFRGCVGCQCDQPPPARA